MTFERALGLEPDLAIAWLWLSTVTERDETTDARINHALDLDLGPPPARMACGELLMVLALRRRRRHSARAREILLEASYALPQDPRVWLAMASTASPASAVAYLERAYEIRGREPERIRRELVSAFATTALTLLRDQRVGSARDTLLRAAAVAPDDYRIWAVAAQLAPTAESAADILRRAMTLNKDAPSVCAELQAARPWAFQWGVRVNPRTSVSDAPSDRGAVDALAALNTALLPEHSLLAEYGSPQADVDLINSAAEWTGQWATHMSAPGGGQPPGAAQKNAAEPHATAFRASEAWPWPARS